jgi:HlyD family secretion protein
MQYGEHRTETARMDIPRHSVRTRKRIVRTAIGVVFVAALLAGTYALVRFMPTAPSVNRSQLTIATVQRGDINLEVRGYGKLVAKDLLYIAAPCEGRVDSIHILPGTSVSRDDVVIVLANPQLELDVLNAEARLRESESNREDTKARLDTEYMTQKAEVASVKASYLDAKLQAERDEELFKERLVSDIARKGSRIRADAFRERLAIEEESLVTARQGAQAQLAAAEARIAQDKAALAFARKQVERLQIRAGADGVLQELLVKTGEQVGAGKSLAVVVNPSQLKAEIRVAETQAKDIALGQIATVDTHNGDAPGRVSRIDPTVTEGTVAVDIEFDGPLPAGVRPDLSVTGVIEIERLQDVLHVERPAQGAPNTTIGLFRLSPDGTTATRVPVQLGQFSVTEAVVLGGLREGDRVILSDMTQWDEEDTLRLE